MLLWKLQKCQILPVNQNLSSVYFLLAKFQLVSFNLSHAMIWQMTCTHKLPKLCSATLINGLSSVKSPVAPAQTDTIRQTDGPLVPMVRLVPIEKHPIPMVLLVHMHLIKET